MAKFIGLYGGTFDPIHWGHISLAFEIKEKRGLDEVWFCPARINPLKLNDKSGALPEQRMELLHLALEKIPDFRILDIEIQREGPSYTIDTLKYLFAKESGNQYALMIGEDAVQDFFKWRLPEEIVSLVPIFVGSRSSHASPQDLQGPPGICQALIDGWTPTRIMEISATEIRQRIKQGLYCGHLMPKESLDYIYKNQLYYLHHEE